MTMKYLSFEVVIDPIPLARPKFSKGHAYLPQRSRDYREIIQMAARIAMAKFEPMKGALFCRLKFFRKFSNTVKNFGDIDNLAKAILDALNGVCYTDDAQIVKLEVSKATDKTDPHVAIEIGDISLEKEEMDFEGYHERIDRFTKRK